MHPRRPRRLATALASAAALFLVPLAGTPAAQAAGPDPYGPLRSQLDAILSDKLATGPGDTVGLVVRDAATGEVLFSRQGRTPLKPASNTKIFSSAAGMDTLGPGYRWHTEVRLTQQPVDGVVPGDVYVKGYGDPTTLQSDYADLAQQVREAGITRVDGRVLVDDTYFDAERYGYNWHPGDFPYYYSAQIAALTLAPNTDYDSGTVILRALPGAKKGDPAVVSVIPGTDGLVRLSNDVRTVKPGGSTSLDVDREDGTNHVTLSGTIAADAGEQLEWVTVDDPAVVAGTVFRGELAAAGVTVTGGVEHAPAPLSSSVTGTDRSMTLAELLTPWMKLSNNMHAEHVTKTMGAEVFGPAGTWDKGLRVTTAYTAAQGIDRSQFEWVDGSGLSHWNRVSPAAVSKFLVAEQSEPWFDTWYASFPVAGNPARFVGGSLRSRMSGTPAADNLVGKTGSLNGVTALSGYVRDADDRLLTFSMISNYKGDSPRSLEDEVGVALASYDPTP